MRHTLNKGLVLSPSLHRYKSLPSLGRRYPRNIISVLLCMAVLSSLLLASPIPALAATLTLDPSTGPAGTVIAISGSGFTSGLTYVWFDSDKDGVKDSSEPQQFINTAPYSGSLPPGLTLTVPDVDEDEYQILVDVLSTGSVDASATFTVAGPSLSLQPNSGPNHTEITVTGQGFDPDTTGWLWFDTDDDSFRDSGEPQAAVTTTAAGNLPAGIDLTAPMLTVGITYRVCADIPGDGTIEASKGFLATAGDNASTALTVTRYDPYGNIINQTIKTWQEMQAELPIYGDGVTHYYFHGPTFNDSSLDALWDPDEVINIDSRDYGASMGTSVKDLCNLIGGASPGDTIQVKAVDNFYKWFDYEDVYHPEPEQGEIVVTWYTADTIEGKDGYVPGYETGMRLIFFPTTKNPDGKYVFGIWDMHQYLPASRWHYYYDGKLWPSSSGLSVKFVSNINIYQPNLVSCNASGNPKNDFAAGETVYVKCLGLSHNTSYKIWIQGEPALLLPLNEIDRPSGQSYAFNTSNDPSGTQETITTDGNGDFSPVAIWSAAGAIGKYDIVADSQSSGTVGTYDSGDYIDNPGWQGFSVAIPATQPPVADFTADVTSGTAPLTVHFTDQSTGTPTAWSWDFDHDGTPDSSTQNPTYTYNTAGTYTVNLTVHNTAGSDSEVKTDYITVTAPSPPVAAFTADVTTGSAPLTVHFTDQSTGTPTAWSWDFNHDGTVDSTTRNPSYTYNTAGTYTVNLTVKNTAASDSEVKTDYITVTASSQPDCDLNGDHVCNICDVVVIGLHWGETGASGWIPEDVNDDGRVDTLDVALIDQHWEKL